MSSEEQAVESTSPVPEVAPEVTPEQPEQTVDESTVPAPEVAPEQAAEQPEQVAESSTPTPEVTAEVTPEATPAPEVAPEVAPEATPAPEIAPEEAPEATPTPEATPEATPAPEVTTPETTPEATPEQAAASADPAPEPEAAPAPAPAPEVVSEQVVASTSTAPAPESSIATNAPILRTKASAEKRHVDPKKQSVDIGNNIRRVAGCEDVLITRMFEDVSTIYSSFKRAVEKYGPQNALGHRPIVDGKAQPFSYLTFEQVGVRVHNVASGLRKLGLQAGDHVGIYSKNRVEWTLSSYGCDSQSITTVALYDTLGEESSLYIINHAELKAIFCEAKSVVNVLKMLAQCQYLKHIISYDEVTQEQRDEAQKHNVQLIHMSELEKLGEENPVDDVPPQPDALAIIMYTSGTTGVPKGVMLTHANVIAACSGVYHNIFLLSREDSYLSYLPLAHILARASETILFGVGATIGYYQGDALKLRDDLVEFKPTILAAVPRVLDRFYDLMNAKIATSGSITKYLINRAFAAKKEAIRTGGSTPIYDRIVFSKFKESLGGRIRGVLSGGAPLRPEVQEFLRIALDCPVSQGYGATETAAGSTIQLPYDDTPGHVGAPIPSVEIKLDDVPELNYTNAQNPPTGEICIRGGCVSLGYYKELEKTREVFDEEGWYHTGDIGRWNPNGTLSIIDRKKNIFKLSIGEYVAAENLENIYSQSNFMARIFVYGDSFKSYLIAIGVVDTAYLTSWAAGLNLPNANNAAELVKSPDVVQAVLKDLTDVAKRNNLRGFEFIKNIRLLAADFDPQFMTPTMKMKRNELKNHYENDINELYAESDAKIASTSAAKN